MLGDRGQIKVSNTVTTKEFPPVLDLIAPVIGTFGLVVGAVDAAGSIWLSVARTLVGAAFLGQYQIRCFWATGIWCNPDFRATQYLH